MPTRPFWFTDTISLGANATADAQLVVSNGEVGRIKRVLFIASGAFNLVGLKDSTGLAYSNASPNDPVPSTQLASDQDADAAAQHFDPPLELEGPAQLLVTLTDTSGSANTVRVIAEGEKET